jgi:hypothetical protein
MLINQYFDPMGHTLHPTAFDDFQNYLSDLGMPKKTINWAIANGSGIGTPIENTAWTPLLETSCNATNIFSGDEFRMWLYAAPGNPDHAFSTSEMNVIADLIYSETYSSFLSFAYIEYSGVYSISSSAPALDYRPGGYRTSVKELVDVVNGNSDYLSECNFISSDQYALKHSFITPQSALDFQGNQNIGILDALVAEPNTTPFDDWYVPAGVNQPHVAMTPQNIQWLLNKIDAINGSMAMGESFPCSPYLYGSSDDEYLFPTTITGIQEVVLNGQGLIHCSQNQQVQIPHLKMRLLPQCNHSGFVLKDKTILKIGEPDGSKKCQLKLSPESSIVMYDKSCLILGLGSQIIVGPGSRIILEDLSSILNMGGEIVVQEGGQIHFNGLNLSLEHDQAQLILEEGLLRIADGKLLALQPTIGATGMMVIKSQHQPAVEFGVGSKLILRGDNRDDDVMRIDSMSNFFSQNDYQGSVFIENGAVRFEKDAQWFNQTLVKLEKAKLYAVGSYENEQCDVVFQNNKVMMTGCIWHHLSVCGLKSHLRSNTTRWIGNEIQQWVKGSLTITESDMIGVGWECEFVELPFSFRNVTFSGNGNPFGMRVIGLNNAPLVIEECDFSDYDLGLFQSGGELKVACSRFSQLSDAMVLLNGTSLIMNNGAGRNAFQDNNRHIVFNEVSSPGLFNGGNWFGSANQYAIYGLLTVPISGAIMDWSGNDWLGNMIYVESYFQPEPNELSVNAIALAPTQPFESCKKESGDVKLNLTESNTQGIFGDAQEIAKFAVYDARGQLLIRDLDALQFREWRSKDGVASGFYIVLLEERNKIQVEKLLIP